MVWINGKDVTYYVSCIYSGSYNFYSYFVILLNYNFLKTIKMFKYIVTAIAVSLCFKYEKYKFHWRQENMSLTQDLYTKIR